MNERTRFELHKFSAQRKFKNLRPGCTLEEDNGNLCDPEIVAVFDKKADGLEAVSKLETWIDKISHDLYQAEEFALVEVTLEEDGEWCAGDVWEFSVWPETINGPCGECKWDKWLERFEPIDDED